MRETILKKLTEIEKSENIKIIHAVESGSRAWGFASPDSDYDVRFFYIRERDYYLRLDKTRDVVEYPIDAVLDINGWDLDKTLRLLHSSNPTLFEWGNSPIIYKTTPFFAEIKSIVNDYFKKKAGLYHYLNMADGNYRAYLKGETVRAKKYFYVIRPILACKWILKNNCPPPMEFAILADTMLDESVKPAVSDLLKKKMSLAEIGEIPKIAVLNEFIENSLVSIKQEIQALPKETKTEYTQLNQLFLRALNLHKAGEQSCR
ncbi:MAG: nucleotidyltransferase domain-containing protein [Firmicutes bacterium]|nr:nucleotidyltransferase domain-containing protein [Bacillota bacterium]